MEKLIEFNSSYINKEQFENIDKYLKENYKYILGIDPYEKTLNKGVVTFYNKETGEILK